MVTTETSSGPAHAEGFEKTEKTHAHRENVWIESSDEITTRDTMISTTATVIANPMEVAIPMEQHASKEPLSAKGPINFGIVTPGLYRSGYPQVHDYPFIQSLKLKTIVTLVSKEMPDGYQAFMDTNGITHRVFNMAGTKKEVISTEMMQRILDVVTDSANYPLLIHCNHGKHRTGCVVGLIRKASEWEIPAILQEYSHYASPKVRETDLEYLTKFNAMHLESARRKLVIRRTATTVTLNAHTKPNPPPFTFGNFVFFVMVASVALCIFIFTGRTFARTPPTPPRRRETDA